MSEESLAVQKLIVATLRVHAPLLALVPVTNIYDRHGRPDRFPAVIIGEAQTVGDDIDCGELSEVYSTLHVWTREDGFEACKRIAGAVRRAMWNVEGEADGFSMDFRFEDTRFLRDPDGVSAHGVVTFRSNVGEV